MTPLESILYMIWRGIAVGVLISAPMGPVGILCIQRTLDKGRHAGFYTGIGAAISDMFYCLLTGFGLSFIEDFIERNQNVIQLIGSIVLIAFSIYLFRKDPSSPMRRPVPQEVSMKKNILGGFLFTFSNPLIIFLIIGLFARFNFTSPDIPGWAQSVGYLFIAVGALGWWFGITYAIEKVRSRFNMRSMKIMNITIGVVILCFAGVGIAGSIMGLTSHNANAASPLLHRYHRPDPSDPSAPSPCVSFNLRGSSEAQLDFRLSHPGIRPSFGKPTLPPWQIIMICQSADSQASPAGSDAPESRRQTDTLTLRVSLTHHSPTPIGPEAALICDASHSGGIYISPTHITSEKLSDGVNLHGGANHYRLSINQAALTLMAGDRTLHPLISIPLHAPLRVTDISITPADESSEIAITSARVTYTPAPPRAHLSMTEIYERCRLSSDPVEGRWRILDWNLDQNLARRGGDYTLAIIHRPDGVYELVYLDGAATNPREWAPGMLKGELHPTGIPFTYRLVWHDSEGVAMTDGLSAQAFPVQQTLLLSFPHLSATLRLIRI